MNMTRIESSNWTTVTLIFGLILFIATTTVTATVTPKFENGKEDSVSIPTFSFEDLRRISSGSNGHRADDFRNALSTNGLLAIQLSDDNDDNDNDNDNEQNNYERYTTNSHHSDHRRIALNGLCSCVDHPEFLKLDQTHELTLAGSSTTRTSVATATVGLGLPLPLPNEMKETCGETVLDAMEELRDSVASVSEAFVTALDQSLVFQNNPNSNGNRNSNSNSNTPPTTLLRDKFGKSYESLADIVHANTASHLEHFHVYTNNQQAEEGNTKTNANANANTAAWDWHTDAGLFLVFVPAWDCNGGENNNDNNNNQDDSFYYRDSDGKAVRAKFDGSNTAIVMLGQGAQDWLDLPQSALPSNQKQKSALKATTHSVRWSEQQPGLPKQRRAWYGMMNLVPETALIYGGKSLREVKESLSLSNQRKNDWQLHSEVESRGGISLGCGGIPAEEHSEEIVSEPEAYQTTARRQRHLQMQDASQCNNVTNFFCWMTCMDIPEIDETPLYLEAGYSLYCLDKSIMRSSGFLSTAHDACIDVHNMGCKGQWEKTDEDVPSVEIDIAAILSGDEIDYPFCYSGTTMYMEGFQWIQSSTCVIVLFPSWVLNTHWKYVLAVIGTILCAIGLEKFIQQRRSTMASMEPGTARLVASTAFYAVQLSIGYVLMLIIMIYSGVLFLSVILGLVIGHVLFNARDAIWPIYESPHLTNENDVDDDENTATEENKSDENHGIESALPTRQLSCCAPTRDSSKRSLVGEERALREGSTHCQEFESDADDHEYYGSLENGKTTQGNQQDGANGARKKRESRRKTKAVDPGVPEGSTPCCQHGL